MKRLFLFGAGLLLMCSLSACNKNNEPTATAVPVTDSPTELAATDTPVETDVITITDEPIAETDGSNNQIDAEATEIPLDFQKEGWISEDEAITLLKMYLGSYDDNGNEFTFGHESTILKDGKYYYNFRIAVLIFSDAGTAHQSYVTNFLVSTDGNDIVEYVME